MGTSICKVLIGSALKLLKKYNVQPEMPRQRYKQIIFVAGLTARVDHILFADNTVTLPFTNLHPARLNKQVFT